LFQLNPRSHTKTKFYCPHCTHPLFLWKQRKDVFIYKCDYDLCSLLLTNKARLNAAEKILAKFKSSQFKLRYQFREYLFTKEQLTHSAPTANASSISNIRHSLNTLCLILTFHISLGISARKTAYILRNVFSINASYQTVLNYSISASHLCHKFNLANKGDVDSTQAGDETYIKVKGLHNFVFFFISAIKRSITAYHIDSSRDTLPATIAMTEALRTAKPNQSFRFITDGNPSYAAGILFLNQSNHNNLVIHNKVIGLQNLDQESATYRAFKQLIERLNRTYKFHVKQANGFKSTLGAIALTTLFVTHYNFLRPHSALRYSVPIPLKELTSIPTLQGKWAKLLKMSLALA